jgi:hypothetical protein
MGDRSATLTIVRDDRGEHIVVTHADDVIWIADEVMAEVAKPDRLRVSGDLDIDGDLVTFGTPGEGLGRLTYWLVGRDEVNGWHIAWRQTEGGEAR